MTKRKGIHHHYESMFEDFLRKNQLLYIAINEAKRPIYKDEKIKNFDFIVVSKSEKLLLIDVKGKQFPYLSSSGENYWENWISKDDGKHLVMWTNIFNKITNNAIGLIVFPYLLKYVKDERLFKESLEFKGKKYALVAIEINEYMKNSKQRSNVFDAISISRRDFPKLVRPFSDYLV